MIKLLDLLTLKDGTQKSQEKDYSTEAAFRKGCKNLPGPIRYALFKRGEFKYESLLGKHVLKVIR